MKTVFPDAKLPKPGPASSKTWLGYSAVWIMLKDHYSYLRV